MISRPKFERRFATAVVASVVALLSFASAAQAVERISVIPGFNGPVNAISEPDSNGTRYLGGDFTAFDVWGTGSGALTSNTSGAVDPSFPKVNGTIHATASDGSGGFYIGGNFTCIGPNTGGSCNGVDDVVRNYAARINADGSVDAAWNPDLGGPTAGVRAIAVSGSTVYLGGWFTTVDSVLGLDKTRNRAAAVNATTGIATDWNPNLNGAVVAIAVSGSTVYLGGWFTTANGGTRTRNKAAAVDATIGIATTWNPNLNNEVLAIAVSGSTVYLGGYFTCIGLNTSGFCNGPNDVPRNDVAAVTTGGTGTVTPWDPDLDDTDGTVNAIAVSGSTVYLGGQFTNVGVTTRNKAAAVNNTNGAATDWNPNLNGNVHAIAVSGNNVYLGGYFTTAGAGATRNRAAAVTTDGTGTLTSWDPGLNDGVLAIAVSGSTVYLGGAFASAGGTTRNRAAAVDADGTLTSWNPDLNSTVNAIGVLGSTVYLGGWFSNVGTTTRRHAAAVTTDGNLVTTWNPNLNDGVSAIGVLGSTVYLGGWFTTVDSVPGLDKTRNRAAAVDATTGIATSWNPNLNNDVYAIAVSGSTVYLGGNFDTVGGTASSKAAAVTTDGNLVTTWNNPNLNDEVLAIAVSDSTVYLGGLFDTVGVTTRNYAAAVTTNGNLVTTWNPNLSDDDDPSVRAIAVLGSTVYLGGWFDTVGGTPRNRAAAVGTDGTLSTTWNPDLNNGVNAIGVSGSTVYLGGYFTTVRGQARNYSAAVGTNGVLLGVWPTLPMLLSVTKSGGGAGTVASSPAGIDCGTTCSKTFAPGTSVTLTATPATVSSFTGWSGSGCSGTSTCTVTMSEARAVNAEFAVVPPGSFNLAVSKSGTGGGTVTSSPAGIDCGSDCSETLAAGTSVTLTATPAAGSSFTGWSGAGCSGTSTCTVTMSAARVVSAEFTKLPSNNFRLRSVKAGLKALTSTVVLPGPGKLTQRVTRSSNLAAVLTVCKTSAKATKAGTVKLSCKLNAATRAALRQRSLRVSVKTTFTPTGGLPASKTQAVTLKSQRPPPYTG